MQDHPMHGRSDHEIPSMRRRALLNAAAWTALSGLASVHAQQRSNVVGQQGDALINGRPLRPEQIIQSGDTIETGPRALLVFAIGEAAFQVRQNSRLRVERGATLHTVGTLRLFKGGVLSVWGEGYRSRIVTPTLVTEIRGGGAVYVENFERIRPRSYLCNCYGTVQLFSSSAKEQSASNYHEAHWADPGNDDDGPLASAPFINHTDEELEHLAGLIDQQTAWQVSGKKQTYSDEGRDKGLLNGTLD